MTQRDRVLHALRTVGPRGLTQVDFLRYPTVDGGPPITRLAARIEELRDDGFSIQGAGVRSKCKVYVLHEPTSAAPVPSAAADPLFKPAALEFDDVCPPRNAIYGDEAA